MNADSMKRRALLSSLAAVSGAGLLWPLRGWSQACSPTGSDTLGPFHIPGAPHTMQLAGPDEPGDPLTVTGRVLAADCLSPLAGALLDLWQADAEGNYHGKENYRLRGHLRTDESGAFTFATIVPGRYKLDGGYRPSHIHLIVSHPLHQSLTTQLYFKGDPYLGKQDACRGDCNSNDVDRIVELTKSASGRGFASDVRLVLRA